MCDTKEILIYEHITINQWISIDFIQTIFSKEKENEFDMIMWHQ